jgi:hypothetical protein
LAKIDRPKGGLGGRRQISAVMEAPCMDALRQFLEDLKQHDLEHGHTLGLFHLLIGRRIQRSDGTVVGRGLTWRELAALLKKARWNKESVRELGLEPRSLPPRDRQQYWYAAIGKAQLDSTAAQQAGDRLASLVQPLGYDVF